MSRLLRIQGDTVAHCASIRCPTPALFRGGNCQGLDVELQKIDRCGRYATQHWLASGQITAPVLLQRFMALQAGPLQDEDIALASLALRNFGPQAQLFRTDMSPLLSHRAFHQQYQEREYHRQYGEYEEHVEVGQRCRLL